MSEPPLTAVVRPLGSASFALLVALLPKCPACLGAYLAVASSAGLDRVCPGALQMIAITGLALALVLLGAAVVTCGRLTDAPRAAQLVGVALLYAGALRIYLGRRPARRACHSS